MGPAAGGPPPSRAGKRRLVSADGAAADLDLDIIADEKTVDRTVDTGNGGRVAVGGVKKNAEVFGDWHYLSPRLRLLGLAAGFSAGGSTGGSTVFSVSACGASTISERDGR